MDPEPHPQPNPPKKLYIAVLFTGQIRTLLHTIDNFRKNVLESNTYHVIHIYTCLEYPESAHYEERQHYKKEIQEIFHSQFGTHLISMIWISSKDPMCRFIREKIVETMSVPDLTKDYLCNGSGSITEYYQLYKGIENVETHAQEHGYHYDLFMRTRCDIMIPHPLDFDPFLYSDDEILQRFRAIRQSFPNASVGECISLYITSLPQTLSRAIERFNTPGFTLESIYKQNCSSFEENERFLKPEKEQNIPEKEIVNYIKRLIKQVFITYRQNLFYLCDYSLLEKINILIINYSYIDESRVKESYLGICKPIKEENVYWWNAENIYQKTIIEKDGVIVNSYTKDEDASLYHANYNTHNNIFYLKR